MDQERAVPRFPGGGSGDWAWPPYAPVAGPQWTVDAEGWAPPSCVRRPWVRLGRWTLLYRRAA